MKIISKEKDFRGWNKFVVRANKKERKNFGEYIKELFIKKYPENDISVLQYLNTSNIFEIGIMPKEN